MEGRCTTGSSHHQREPDGNQRWLGESQRQHREPQGQGAAREEEGGGTCMAAQVLIHRAEGRGRRGQQGKAAAVGGYRSAGSLTQ